MFVGLMKYVWVGGGGNRLRNERFGSFFPSPYTHTSHGDLSGMRQCEGNAGLNRSNDDVSPLLLLV